MDKWLQLEPDDWDELSRLVDTALELPPDRRDQWLESIPEGEIKSRLRSVLSRSERVETSDFLVALPAMKGCEADFDSLKNVVEKPGDQVGPYRLIRELGRGGMSTVWLAERTDGLIRRPVALKLPQGLWRRGTLAERFARERNILAALTHPNIARLYDAGIGAAGQPYLAIEYVEGQPIDVYCTAKDLDLNSRLRLFLHVARAVAHAHAQLVVHRDLKPANILVTPDSEPRLLDFGIAKLLDAEPADGDQHTELAAQAFTPDYAAPEQIAGDPVTTATDVYSLGVLLYELVSLARPYSLNRGSRAALEQSIARAEPPRPSAHSQASWRKLLQGDLDTIILKALKKLPGERYATVSALADDIERHLEHRPVLARPDTLTYRLAKLVQRNRALVAGLGVLAVAIVASAAVALWQAHAARAEARRASEIYEFLASTVRDADPHRGEGRVLSAADLLRQAHQRAASLREHPEQRVAVLTLIATSLLNLEDFDGAEQTATQALSESLATLGPLNEQTVRARMAMVGVHRFRGRTREMRDELKHISAFFASRGAVAPADRYFLLESDAHLSIDAGEYERASTQAGHALEVAQKNFGDRDSRTAAAAVLLAESYEYADVSADDYLRAAEQAFQMTEAIHGANAKHPRLITAREVYGRALATAGQLGPGLRHLETALAQAIEIYGPDSSSVGLLHSHVGRYALRMDRLNSAVSHLDKAIAILGAQTQHDSFTYLGTLGLRGVAHLATRDADQALRDFDETVRGYEKLFGAEHEETLIKKRQRAVALAYAGKTARARAEIAPVVELYRARFSEPLYLPGETYLAAGTVERLAGNDDAARVFLQEAMDATEPGDSAATQRFRSAVLTQRGLLDLQSPDPGPTLALKHLQAADELQQKLGQGGPRRADVLLGMGRAQMSLGSARRALKFLQQADEIWQAVGIRNRWAGEAAAWRALALHELGRARDAQPVRARAVALLSTSEFASDIALVKALREMR